MKLIILSMSLMILPVGRGELPSSTLGAHCLMMRPTLVLAQEGNPSHHEPPKGWHCAGPGGKGDDKGACKCHRECKDRNKLDENGEGTGEKETYIAEDKLCNSWCFADHCTCPIHGCD